MDWIGTIYDDMVYENEYYACCFYFFMLAIFYIKETPLNSLK